ncbi:copper chaperone PCu(A)C [Alkalimarinus alittae]|uniref:Copper chaperone PCu(A)C n=1 Tax=Alkalimarinus alittae TaxID=2961619 RepID=A0ABY6N3D5_9ALTE|nr:copper chaperone PCu(A)C [Alkalimarinus alittae]UZE96601.1 copper chaperone PCu(A)C [Alkalimarinus alittae]
MRQNDAEITRYIDLIVVKIAKSLNALGELMMRWQQYLATTCLMLIVSLTALTAAAEMTHPKKSDIQAHMTWVRAVPPVANTTAAYMMLHNYSQQDDRLIAIESPVAEKVEMHATDMNNGIMRMTKLQGLTVPAKGLVMFEPAGYHIMLINLKQPLNVGSMVPITLVFENHGAVDMKLMVSHPPEGEPDMEMSHGDHQMHH